MISLNNGKVVKTWDMNELKNIVIEDIQNNERYFDAVLNGIAYIKDRDSFLISGKLWGTIFEIKFDYKKYI
jgi:glutamine cyclotransferase